MGITREQAKEYVGIGWAKLIDRFYDFAPVDPEITDVSQVKEKFGSLRIYGIFNEDTYALIEELEMESIATCEFCGEEGTMTNLRGWYKTLCPECVDEVKRQWHIEQSVPSV